MSARTFRKLQQITRLLRVKKITKMVRVPRYPASPVQEIFLPERVPFVQYDASTPSPTGPPPPPPGSAYSSSPSFSQCEAEKNKMRDIAAMFYRGQASVLQLREAKEKFLRCANTCAVWDLIETTHELRDAEDYRVTPEEIEKDQRYKHLTYREVPSILTKYHL